jgi:hypothetical protein
MYIRGKELNESTLGSINDGVKVFWCEIHNLGICRNNAQGKSHNTQYPHGWLINSVFKRNDFLPTTAQTRDK